ncbi:hypothetical protein ENBRE01_2623 [Enteropsectra breve]|nr:hypothetical protein ENBRE01_2623 [Enteropsectra breve]
MANFFQPAKQTELERAINERRFPVVVYGPSGSGKSHLIRKTLEKMQIVPHYAECASKPLRKPLGRKMPITHLYSAADLHNIKYPSIIIETLIPHLSKTSYELFRNASFIHVRPPTATYIKNIAKKNKLTLNTSAYQGNLFSLFMPIPQDISPVEFYRFLGKIFYKKLHIKEIAIDNDEIYFEQLPPKDISTTTTNIDNTRIGNRTEKNSPTNVNINNRRTNTKLAAITKRGSNKENIRINKQRIISESSEEDSSEENSSLLEIDDLMDLEISASECTPSKCQSSEQLEEKTTNSTSLSISSLKTINIKVNLHECNAHKDNTHKDNAHKDNTHKYNTYKCTQDEHSQDEHSNALYGSFAFNKNKTLQYLYENMIDFTDSENITELYESLSLADGSKMGEEAFICCVLNKCKKPTGMVSFRSSSYNINRET